MRIPVDWLNEYVPNDLTVRELAYRLTNVGLEVEAIEEARGEAVLDIKVTPNRGDCLSVLGVARELAMALRTSVKHEAATVAESGPPADGFATVVLDDHSLCPRYSARIVRGVRIAASPEWCQRRLELCGLRPINNVVDATNLAMLELGQPLHAFDRELVRAPDDDERPQIIVRRARTGERLVTIDGEDRELTAEILVIADPSGVIALAGIMGGMSTEIHEGTRDVLLESAHFHPGTVRRGARALGMSTEASYRFERTVDPDGTVRALDRACELIAAFCEATVEVATGVVDAYPEAFGETEIVLRPSRANTLLGLNLTAGEMASHLRLLQLEVEEGDLLRVRVPIFRQDVKDEIDLVEELARGYGYEHIPESLPRGPAAVGCLPPSLALEREVRQILRGLGLSEAVTSSLESPEALARLGLSEDDPLARPVRVSNAKSVDRSQLRTTLLTSLLEVVAHNQRHGVADVSIFDVGRVYWPRGAADLPEEAPHLGLAGCGLRWRDRWAQRRESERWDFYALKGVVESLVEGVARQRAEFAPYSHPSLHPVRSAQVAVGGKAIGWLGQVRSEVCEAYDLTDAVHVAELDLGVLGNQVAEEPRYRPVSRFPAVTRDVAFVVPREIAAGRAEGVIREAGGEDLEEIWLFDAYAGKPLAEGERNLAFSLTFRRGDRTLSDEEVEGAMEGIRRRLREDLGARIRE
jgi:phenylalanyl-tRNA synthetase beta chain